MADINNNSLSEATEDQFQIAVVVLMYSVSVFVFSPCFLAEFTSK